MEKTVRAILLRMPTAEVATRYAARAAGTCSRFGTLRDGVRTLAIVARLIRLDRRLMFSSAAGLPAAAAAASFHPPLVTYLRTALVPRLPAPVVSLGLSAIAIAMFACGLVLDAVARTRLEVHRLRNLNAADERGKGTGSRP